MNNAGLPGTGLGGLFYILLALAMPLVELVRTVQGRSSAERWRRVRTQLALALGIVATTAASATAFTLLVGVPERVGLHGPAVVLGPVLLSLLVLALLLVVIRAWARLHPRAGTGRHRLVVTTRAIR